MKMNRKSRRGQEGPKVLMLLSNCFEPDPRVYAEAHALVTRGYRVRILAWDRDRKRPEREVIDGIEIERIYLSSTHGRGATQALIMFPLFLAMIWRGLRYSFDSIHAHDFDTLPVGYFLGRLKRKPIIYDSHEDFAGMLHGSVPGWMERRIRWLETRLVLHVDVVVTVGEELRRAFERRGCRQTVVVGNWKKLEEFRFDLETRLCTRRDLQIPESALLVSFIANLGRERHLPKLIAAVSQRPEIHLLIGGNGPCAGLAQEAARQFSNIHYLGFVSPKDIGHYTWASDVLFYGFDTENPNAKYSAPNKLFEALAAGRAIITASFGEIGRIVAQHGCGVVLRDFSEVEILRALDLCSAADNLQCWQRQAAELGERLYNWALAEEELLRAYRDQLRLRTGPTTANDTAAKKAIAQ
jgi:glycosyltransferase involved in cell wall biosynthesis